MPEKGKGGFNGLADLVHDMRAPLNAINGFAGAMLDGTVKNEDFPKYLSLIQSESARLNRMVGDMLSAERLSGGAVPLIKTNFNLTEALRLTLLGMEAAIERKSQRVEFFCEECVVTADRELLTEVLYNLLENAVKYTPDEGTISLSLTKSNGSAVLTVKNTCSSIKDADLPYIFDRYYRGYTEKKGTGLGLYIVKSILALHGSDIKAESKEGAYLALSFSLPLAK